MALGGESIISAAVGALAGGGGMKALGRLFGPERDVELHAYYQGVIADLIEENKRLSGELKGVRARVLALEMAQDHPPPYLG